MSPGSNSTSAARKSNWLLPGMTTTFSTPTFNSAAVRPSASEHSIEHGLAQGEMAERRAILQGRPGQGVVRPDSLQRLTGRLDGQGFVIHKADGQGDQVRVSQLLGHQAANQ